MRPPPSTAADPTATRRRRRRVLLTLASISIGWKVLVFTVGAAVPRWLIDDGVGALPHELRPYGRDVKRSAAALWNGPIERYGVVRTLRVVSVQRVSAATAATGAARRCGGLGARVRAYTYFGVPYSEARMVCDSGVVEYRMFRRRGGRSDGGTSEGGMPNGGMPNGGMPNGVVPAASTRGID